MPNTRNIRFQIVSDESSGPPDEAAIQRLRDRAAARAEREIMEQLFQTQPEGAPASFTMEYMNSWGDWAETERQVSQTLRSNREPPVPEDRSTRLTVGNTVTGRMTASQRRAAATLTTGFDREAACRQLRDCGYEDYAVVLEIPGPFPDSQTVGVLECVRDNPSGPTGSVQRRYFSFARVGGRDLQVLAVKSEAEYISDLRRRHRDVSHFYAAQADGRRRMAAKILAGGAEQYQLLLTPVVDDDTLRNNLTSPAHRARMASHGERVKAAAQRMTVIKRQMRDANHVSTAAPEPETERGQRAANAARRRQETDRRSSRPRGLQSTNVTLNGSF